MSNRKIPSMREVCESFAKAETRASELEAKQESLRAELAELERRKAHAEAPDADALLAADDVDAALAGAGTQGLDAQAVEKRRQLETVAAAVAKGRQELEAEKRKARKAVGDRVAKAYKAIARRQALALVELGQAAEDYWQFQNELPGTVAECGLHQFPLNPLTGSTTGGLFHRLVNDAVAAGFVTTSEVPEHWGVKKAA